MNRVQLKNIFINNIWYMLAYSVDFINDLDTGDIDIEDTNGTNELLATLLCITYERLLNTELETDYHSIEMLSDKPYGKLNIIKSYKTGVISRGSLFCDINTEDINSIYNKVIKAAFNILLAYNKISRDKMREKTVNRIVNNLDTLRSIDDIEIYPELVDQIHGIPDRYAAVWIVIKMIVYMQIARDKDGKHCLLELNDSNKLSFIFEKFGLEYAKREYLNGLASKPTYHVKDTHGKITRNNILDMLLLNNNNVSICDFKLYDRASITDDTPNIREVHDYAISFFEEDKRRDKYNSIKCVLIYAYKSDADKPKFKSEETHDIANNKKCTIYRRSVDLSKSFDEIKSQLNKIFDEMLCIE